MTITRTVIAATKLNLNEKEFVTVLEELKEPGRGAATGTLGKFGGALWLLHLMPPALDLLDVDAEVLFINEELLALSPETKLV